MSRAPWEIFAADVSEVEAKVVVRYLGENDEPVVLRGTLRGPYCQRAHTLPADYSFRELDAEKAAAEAVVTDPCLWTAELPHLYQADVEALRGDVVVAEYHGEIGLRRTSPAKNWDTVK
jgi:beta-galactosidase/beta-glucuronidase